MKKLTEIKCIPCEGGMPPLTLEEIEPLKKQIPADWQITGNRILRKHFEFKNFISAMEFINKIAKLAEAEGHHPDFCVSYNKIDITLTTHAIGGLSQNDFILAAKIENLL